MNTLHCPNCGFPSNGSYCAICQPKAFELSGKGAKSINPFLPGPYNPGHLESLERNMDNLYLTNKNNWWDKKY